MKNLKLTFLAIMATLALVSCEKNYIDEQEETKEESLCKIVIDAHIVTGKYYPEYSCHLYDVNLVSSNGEVYTLGNVPHGNSRTFTLPSSHKNTDMMIMAFKLAKNESDSKNAYYLCPCMSDGTPFPIYAVDYKTAVFSVNDDMVFRTYKYKTVEELKKYASSVADELNSAK